MADEPAEVVVVVHPERRHQARQAPQQLQRREPQRRPAIGHRPLEPQDQLAAILRVRAWAALQLNLGSLWGRYGRGARKTASRLLEAGLYAVAASDLHQAEDAQRWLEAALRELEKQAGAPAVRRLLEVNPARVAHGEDGEGERAGRTLEQVQGK